MHYFLKFLWVLGLAVVLWLVNWFAQRGYFNKAKSSIDGTLYKFDLTNWNFYFRIFSVVALILTALLAGCTSGADTPTPPVAAAANCQGSYAGNYSPPDHDERIRLRNMSLVNRGIAVTGNDDVDNAAAGGGPPDGGIWMGGSYAFETDANCNVVKGKTQIFYAYEYDIGGTVQKDGTFKLTWSGQGSAGEMFGKIEANNTITGEFHHPKPDDFVYGVLSGTFTPVAK
jgi:hypothetical protein